MSFFKRDKEEIISLNLNKQEAETGKEEKEGGGSDGGSFDSAKAEQLELFQEDRSVEEIGRERVAKAVDAGKRAFAKAGGLFRSAWNKGKGGAGKALAYAAAPDALANEIGKKIDGQLERFSDASERMQNAAGERMDDIGAGMDSFVDRTKDSLLSKYAERIGLRDRGMVPKITSPEAKNSILGLEGDERSMGGELIVGGTVFDRVKEFVGQMRSIRRQYEAQQAAAAERRKAGEEWLAEKQRNKVTGRKAAEGVAMKRAEDRINEQLKFAQSGNFIKFESFAQAMKFMDEAKGLGIDLDGSRMKIEIGKERSEETVEAAA